MNSPLPPPLPVLYSFRRCPYAIRARLALACSGVAVALHEVDLKHKPAALLAVSPKGTVPVLHLADGTVLEQSLDIMRWALAQHDPQRWLHSTLPERNQALVQAADGPFKHWLDRYKYLSRHPGETANHCREQAATALLDALERSLAAPAGVAGQAPVQTAAPADGLWLSGHDHPCLADAAIFPLVRQFAGVDATWFATAPWPGVRQWLGTWLASDLFRRVMAKPPTQ